jgi:hypothetical protein
VEAEFMNEHCRRRRSKTDQAYDRLRKALQDFVLHAEIRPSARFDALIPPGERRLVWSRLQMEGLELPALQLSSRALFLIVVLVLAPVLALYVVLSWTALFSLAELSFLARKVARPWAIHPPRGCETVREAALQLAPFSRQDYQAGLWPRKDIADKVRLIVARAAGVPFESITEETRFSDLLECT